MSRHRTTRPGFCSGHVYDGRAGFHPCSNRGSVTEDGKRWCKIHQPSRVAAKRAERDRKFDERWKAQQARFDRDDRIRTAEHLLVEAVLRAVNLGKPLRELAAEVRKARAS